MHGLRGGSCVCLRDDVGLAGWTPWPDLALAPRCSSHTKSTDAIIKAARDQSADVKAAAARATGRLLLAQVAEGGGGGAPPSLPALLSTAMALVGMDQDSEVQRTMLSVLRRLAAASPGCLQPHWKELVPSICAIVQVSERRALRAQPK